MANEASAENSSAELVEVRNIEESDLEMLEVPQGVLTKLLAGVDLLPGRNTLPAGRIEVGMDSAVIPLARNNLVLVQSVDFFYPLVDDPVVMGRIAFANMASDIYATGVDVLDKVSMICSCPEEFSEVERDVIIPLIVKGFREAAVEAGCEVTVRGFAVNPWCILGGVATSICRPEEVIYPGNAVPGDVLVLTKPLGTQLATNAYLWMLDDSDSWRKLKESFEEDEILQIYRKAVDSMTFLNRTAAQLMHKYSAHAATDITGFGLVGHARNLVGFQKNSLKFIVNILPIFGNVEKMARILGREKKLLAGEAVETSGGLLIALKREFAMEFCQEFKEKTSRKAWIVGFVEDSVSPDVEVVEGCTVIDV
ncbi:Selenide, water dikinase 2 [Sergentomyia squamirostris]